MQIDEGTNEAECISTDVCISLMEEHTRGLEQKHFTSEKCVM